MKTVNWSRSWNSILIYLHVWCGYMDFTKMYQIHEIHENTDSHWCCPKHGKSWRVKMRVIGREKAVIGHENTVKNVKVISDILEQENHENPWKSRKSRKITKIHENPTKTPRKPRKSHENHENHETHERVAFSQSAFSQSAFSQIAFSQSADHYIWVSVYRPAQKS